MISASLPAASLDSNPASLAPASGVAKPGRPVYPGKGLSLLQAMARAAKSSSPAVVLFPTEAARRERPEKCASHSVKGGGPATRPGHGFDAQAQFAGEQERCRAGEFLQSIVDVTGEALADESVVHEAQVGAVIFDRIDRQVERGARSDELAAPPIGLSCQFDHFASVPWLEQGSAVVRHGPVIRLVQDASVHVNPQPAHKQ